MARVEQADSIIKFGFAVAGSAVCGELLVNAIDKGSPLSEKVVPIVITILVLGLSIALFGMIYKRVVDIRACFFCSANVPAFYTEESEGPDPVTVCDVCLKKREQYPLGSERLPVKKPCQWCDARLYTSHMYALDGGKNDEWVCVGCFRAIAQIKSEVIAYAKQKGVPLTMDLYHEWIALENTAATLKRTL